MNLLAYIVHGPVRVVLDGFRVYCFIVGVALAGALVLYANRLRKYTRSVEWQGSMRAYGRAWSSHNKRLLGRILLTITLIGFDLSAVGTEILRRWGHDMGYWRLPINAISVTVGLFAIVFLLLWNSLSQEESPGLAPVGPPAKPEKAKAPHRSSSLLSWTMVLLAFFGWLAFKGYEDHQQPDRGIRCIVAALAMHQQDATAAHQADANATHFIYTAPSVLADETVEDVRTKCGPYIAPAP